MLKTPLNVVFGTDEVNNLELPLPVHSIWVADEEVTLRYFMNGVARKGGHLTIELASLEVAFTPTKTIFLNRIRDGLVVRGMGRTPMILYWSLYGPTGLIDNHILIKASADERQVVMEMGQEETIWQDSKVLLTLPSKNVLLFFERTWKAEVV